MTTALPRAWDQEPLVPQEPAKPPALNLDELIAEGGRRGMGPDVVLAKTVKYARDNGIGDLTYQGKTVYLSAANAPQEPAQPVTGQPAIQYGRENLQALRQAPIRGHGERRPEEEYVAAERQSNEFLDMVHRSKVQRSHQDWSRDWSYSGSVDLTSVPSELATKEEQFIRAAALADANGDRAKFLKMLDAMSGLSEESRARVGAGISNWKKFSDERALPFQPAFGEGYLAYDGKDRLNALMMIADRPEDEISKMVWDDYVIPQLGPEAMGYMAQIRAAGQAAKILDFTARVGDDPTANDYVSAYQALRTMRETRTAAPSLETFRFATLLRMRLEQDAEQVGVAFEPMDEALKVETPQWMTGDPKLLKKAAESGAPLGSIRIDADRDIKKFFDETEDLAKRLAERRYGREAAEAVIKANEIESTAYRAAFEMLEMIPTGELEKAGRFADEEKLKRLRVLIGALEQDPSSVNPGEEHAVHLGSWFLNALTAADRGLGTSLAWFMGSRPRAALWATPDGAVFDDPLELGVYLEKKIRSDPGRYVWEEDPTIAARGMGDWLGVLAKDVGRHQEYVKPTIIALDAKQYAEQKSYAHGPIGGWKTIHEAITDRALASIAPDDSFARGVVNIGAFGISVAADPLNFVSFGGVNASLSVARYRKTVAAMADMGIDLPKIAVKAGVNDPLDLARWANMDEALKSARVTGSAPAKITLLDGTVLNPDRHGKFRALSEIFRGGDGGSMIAGRIMEEAIHNPLWIQRFLDVELANPTFRGWLYDAMTDAGMKVYNSGHAAAIFREMLPYADKLMRNTSDLGAVGKMQARWAEVFLGQDAILATMAKSRGLYLGRFNPFELLGPPVRASAEGINVAMQPTIDVFRAIPGGPWQTIEKGGRLLGEGYRAMKSLVRTGTIPLTVEKGVRAAGGGEATAYRPFAFVNAPYFLVSATRRHRQASASATTAVEGQMVRWLSAGSVDKKGNVDMKLAAKRLKETPESAYEDVLHALEAPNSDPSFEFASFTDAVQHLALRDVVRENMAEIQAGIKATRGNGKAVSQFIGSELERLSKMITPDHVKRVVDRFRPMREQWQELQKVLGEMAHQRRLLGLGSNRAGYAPHMFEKSLKPSLLQEAFNKNHDFFGPEGGTIFRDSFSTYNWERTGPPTLLIAEIAGMKAVTDARSIMYHRLERHMHDAADAIFLKEVVGRYGWEMPGGQGAVRALMEGVPHLNDPTAVEELLGKLTSRAAQMEAEYVKASKLVIDARRARAKLERHLNRVAKSGTLALEKSVASLERKLGDAQARYQFAIKNLGEAKRNLVEAARAESDRPGLKIVKEFNEVPPHKPKKVGRVEPVKESHALAKAKSRLASAQEAADKAKLELDRATVHYENETKRLSAIIPGDARSALEVLPNMEELRLLRHDAEQKLLAAQQAAADMGTTYGLDADQVQRIAQHSTHGQRTLQNLRANVNRKLKDPRLTKEAREELKAQKNVLDDKLHQYSAAREKFRAMGVSERDEAALVMHLYKKPSIYHLELDEVHMLLDRQAKMGSAIDDVIQGTVVHGDLDSATEAFRETREFGTHYAKWSDDASFPLTKMLSNTYLPVEIVLAMRSYGFRVGRALEKDMALYAGFTKFRAGLLRAFNKQWRTNVTVYNPSLHFGFRAQFDAFMKRAMYSGMRVFSPLLYRDFDNWRRGAGDGRIVDATGRTLERMETFDQIGPLFQTFEQRADVVGTVAAAGPAEASQMVSKRVARSMAAGDTQRKGLTLSASATRGRPPRIGERLVPFGPPAVEAFDNEAKAWIYYVSRRAGFNHRHAMQEAFDWGRDFSNLTGAELLLADVQPVAFYNFFKQNTKALIEMVKSGNLARLAWWPKFKEAMEADLPEEMRPAWSNMMDSIVMGGGNYVLATDLGSVAVFDGFATFLNAWRLGQGKTGFFEAAGIGGREQMNSFLPAWQAMLASFDEDNDLAITRRMRIPPHLVREIGMVLSGTDGEEMAGEYLGGQIVIHVKNGVPSMEITRGLEFGLALTGYSVWATTIMRQWDHARNGDLVDWILKGNLLKHYEHNIVSERRLSATRREVEAILDSMTFFAEGGEGNMQLQDSLPEETFRIAQILLQQPEIFDQMVGDLYTVLGQIRPGTGRPLPQE